MLQAAPDREVVVMSHDTGLSAEEKVASLFQPDTLLPAQYLETFRRKSYLEPEKRLMLAVLEDAIACFQKYVCARDGKGMALFREAEGWILEEKNDFLFSSGNACEVLGFNPRYIRQGLLRWKERRLAAQAKVYRLAPRKGRKKPSVVISGRTGQRLLKAASR